MDLKKIDIKTWAIIVLGIALIISFFFGQRNNIDTHKDEIKILHESNDNLKRNNDSIKKVNLNLDRYISEITKQLLENNKIFIKTQEELDKLKKRKNETYTHVNNLSANGVANAFSDYLNTKGTNPR